MLLWNNFENLHTVTLFWCLKFFDPNSECFAKYDTFCSQVFDVRANGVKLIAIEEVRNYEKIATTSKTFSKWLVGGCIFLILPPGHKLQKPSKESGVF